MVPSAKICGYIFFWGRKVLLLKIPEVCPHKRGTLVRYLCIVGIAFPVVNVNLSRNRRFLGIVPPWELFAPAKNFPLPGKCSPFALSVSLPRWFSLPKWSWYPCPPCSQMEPLALCAPNHTGGHLIGSYKCACRKIPDVGCFSGAQGENFPPECETFAQKLGFLNR